MLELFGIAPQKSTLTPAQKKWVEDTIALLKIYDDRRLVGRDIFQRDEAIQMTANLLELSQLGGYPLLAVKQILLGQLLFAALVTGSDESGVITWASQGLQLTPEQIQATLTDVKARVPVQPKFVNEAPQSIQSAGGKMVQVWQGFKVSVEFVGGNESGLRHYSLRFRKPETITFDQIESKLQDVLSHGGFHPGIPVIFSRLPSGEFEIHVPKEQAQWRSFSFIEYLWQSIEYQPHRGLPGNQVLAHSVKAICTHYHSRASLHKAPLVPIGIDIYGIPAEVHFGSGGVIVGAPDMGKSTHMKLVAIMLMLMFPPKLFRFAAIDLKRSAFKRFSKDWRNPWMLGTVVTDESVDLLPSLFENLARQRAARAELLDQSDCENWLEYNAQNPGNPIPFSPLFVDEISMLKEMMDKAEADRWISEISSRWRSVGMPLIAGTQYPAAQLSLPPSVRGNLNTKVAFKSSANCAENAFDALETIRAVTKLLGHGDFIAQSPGSPVMIHGQGLDAPGKLVAQVLEILKSQFPEASDWFDLQSPLGDDPWEASSGAEISCPKCQSKVTKNGREGAKQKYKCKAGGCGHVFTN